MRDLAIRASLFALAGTFSSQTVRLLGNLILTRLLFPEAFGLMAIINVVLYGLQMMSDVGIGTSLMQSRRDDTAFVDTLWTVQVVRGFALFAVAALAALPLSTLYAMPELRALLPVVALSAVFGGFESTRLFSLNRQLALGRLTLIELVAQLFGVVVMVVHALLAPTVWALVSGALSGSALKLALSHLAIPGPTHRFRWDRAAALELSGFGRWIFLSSATNFLSARGDVLLLGWLLPLDLLGVYSLAIMLTDSVGNVVGTLRRRVILPVLSRVVREDRARLREIYYRTRRSIELLVLPVACLLIAAGDGLIHVLYDARYAEAGWMVRILALRLLIAVIGGPGVLCLVSLGKPQYMFWGNLSQGLWLVAFIPLAMQVGGLHAMIWSVALYDLLAAVIVSAGLVRWGVFVRGAELRYLVASMLCLAIALVARAQVLVLLQ